MNDTPVTTARTEAVRTASRQPSEEEGKQGTAVLARAMRGPREPFETMTITRRQPRPRDVLIDIAFAGICHSDVHHARAEWGSTTFPIVPGHEIAGTVSAVGGEVTRFAVGDRVGVGCLVNACGDCQACTAGEEQYCDHHVLTYNARDHDGTLTHGGYSEYIVVDERFVVRIPDALGLARPHRCCARASPSTHPCGGGTPVPGPAWASSVSAAWGTSEPRSRRPSARTPPCSRSTRSNATTRCAWAPTTSCSPRRENRPWLAPAPSICSCPQSPSPWTWTPTWRCSPSGARS